MSHKIDICAGGTIAADGKSSATLTLENYHHKICKVKNLNLPNANPPGPYSVPEKSHGVPGTLSISFTPTPGEYPYEPDCCSTDGNPVIIVIP